MYKSWSSNRSTINSKVVRISNLLLIHHNINPLPPPSILLSLLQQQSPPSLSFPLTRPLSLYPSPLLPPNNQISSWNFERNNKVFCLSMVLLSWYRFADWLHENWRIAGRSKFWVLYSWIFGNVALIEHLCIDLIESFKKERLKFCSFEDLVSKYRDGWYFLFKCL